MVPKKRTCALGAILIAGCLLSSTVEAGLPWSKRSDYKKGTPEWWAARAAEPSGVRQKTRFGKVWPPDPRPSGPKQPFVHKYYDSHYWPHPYLQQDRDYVRQITDMQVNAGWVSATTLYDYHFDDEGGLNRAGRTRLQWIIGHVPQQYRYIFVQTSRLPSVSKTRMASTQEEATILAAGGDIPPITARVASPLGRPAEEVDRIRRRDLETLPPPRISPAITGASSGYGPGAGG